MVTGLRYIACTVDAAHDGTRVYEVLRGQLGTSDGTVRRAKHVPAGLLLDGAPTWAKAPVRAGQRVSLAIAGPGMPGSCTALAPEHAPLAVAYADADVLVAEKPAGLVMYPSPGHPAETLANRVAGWLEAHGMQAGVQAAHRLDRDTSGLAVFALNSHAKDRLQSQLHTAAFAREYLALCVGWPDADAGTVRAPLGRLSAHPNVYGVDFAQGKPAATRYQVLARGTLPAGAPATGGPSEGGTCGGSPRAGMQPGDVPPDDETSGGRLPGNGAPDDGDFPGGSAATGAQTAGAQPAGARAAGAQPAGARAAGTPPAGVQAAGAQAAGTPPAGLRMALLRLQLETGRTHQVRIHMAYIGHPLLGDGAYGQPSPYIGRTALHSARIAFAHPVDGRLLEFASAPPADMQCILEAAGIAGWPST